MPLEHIKKSLKEKNIILKGFDPLSREGFTQVPNKILRDPKLSDGAVMVYSLLLSYAWHKDYCFPGQKRLGKNRGKTERWANKYISELKKSGYLEIKRRGLGKTNIYILYAKPKR